MEKNPNLSRGLDYYKLTMGQVAFEQQPEAEVTFTLKNRNTTQPLSEYVSPEALTGRLDAIRQQGFTPEEIAYYAGLQAQDGQARFTAEYLDHLADLILPDVNVSLNPDTKDLSVSTTGPWPDVSLWETVIMSEVNEEYYAELLESNGLTLQDLYDEGDRRLSQKIARLQQRPDIQFSDFGTRRRFSADWHEHVVARLKAEVPANFIGTSNPWFAYKYDLQPIGTFAHEMPMVYAALADNAGNDPLSGHAQMLDEWYQRYGEDLSIALTDTFGTDFFFSDFSPEQAKQWRGLRHDSGDPILFGENVLNFYANLGIDPLTKTIVFSDGLDIAMIEKLADHFGGKIKIMFGWGTSLMNDLGLPANNFVAKATCVNGMPTVKLSDSEGKHTGPEVKVIQYQQAKMHYRGALAVRQLVTV